MNKKGFTLVELLAVIAILGTIMTLATISVFKVMNDSKSKLSDFTKTQIEDAANLYAIDNDCTEEGRCSFFGDGIIDALGDYYPEMAEKCDVEGGSVTIYQEPVDATNNYSGGEVTVEISDNIVCEK